MPAEAQIKEPAVTTESQCDLPVNMHEGLICRIQWKVSVLMRKTEITRGEE